MGPPRRRGGRPFIESIAAISRARPSRSASLSQEAASISSTVTINAPPAGARAEICIGGIGLARGYARRPDYTAEKFVPDPFSIEPGARMYRSGDLARD